MSLCQDEQFSQQRGVFENPEVQSAIDHVLQGLPEKANVLTLGRESLQPLAAKLSSAGNKVHCIDASEPPVSTGSSETANPSFERANVKGYSPKTSFDAIVAIFSLYHLTRAETYTQLFKFSEWLRPGGQLVLATTVIDSLNVGDQCQDCVDECMRCYPVTCMGKQLKATVFSKKGWASMCSKAGLTTEYQVDFTIQLGSALERHHIMALRKTEKQALVGPYPIPESYRGPHRLSEAAWEPFASRLVRDEFDAVLETLKDNQKVLDVGSGYGSKSSNFDHDCNTD